MISIDIFVVHPITEPAKVGAPFLFACLVVDLNLRFLLNFAFSDQDSVVNALRTCNACEIYL